MGTISKLKCRHCGHEWYPRTEKEPEVCPKCKRYNWKEVPKKREPWEVEDGEVTETPEKEQSNNKEKDQ